MAWYPALGYGVLWISLVVAIILFAVKRKWYPIVYIISIATYIFTLGFVIDVYDFSKNGVMLSLAFTAALMMVVGLYLSKKFRK